MFIRTIKMINERKDETIRKLLSNSQQDQVNSFREPAFNPQTTTTTTTTTSSKNNNLEELSREQSIISSNRGEQNFLTTQPTTAWHAPFTGSEPEAGQIHESLEQYQRHGDRYYKQNYNINDRHKSPQRNRSNEQLIGRADVADTSASGGPISAADSYYGGNLASFVKLEPMIEFILDRDSAFEADGKVCQLIESGVHALLGPIDGNSVQHVQSICDNLEIPYFELRPFLGSPAATPPQQPPPISPFQTLALTNLPPDEPPPPPLSSSSLSSLSSSSSASHTVPSVDSHPRVANPAETDSKEFRPGSVTGQLLTGSQQEELTLNLHPPAHLLTSAYMDLIYAWNWTSFAIVYEEGSSMIKLQDLFRESSGTWTSKWQIKLFQFDSSASINANGQHGGTSKKMEPEMVMATVAPLSATKSINSSMGPHSDQQQPSRSSSSSFTRSTRVKSLTFRDIFWKIKLSGEQNILLDVKAENLYEALKQAQQVGCMTEGFSYLITSLDLHTLDLEDFKYSRTRITGFSLIQVIKHRRDPASYSSSSLLSTDEPSGGSISSTTSGAGNATSSSSGNNNDDTMVHNESVSHAPDNSITIDDKYLERLGVRVSKSSIEHTTGSERSQRDPLAGGGPKTNSKSSYNAYEAYTNGASRSSSSSSSSFEAGSGVGSDGRNGYTRNRKLNPKYKLSPSITLERSGSFMDPPQDAYNRDWFRKEMLLSSPASMGLLPTLDRDNEQRLFEFFVEQQESNLPRVKMSTSSAILHDSLILYMRGLQELDPTGSLLKNYTLDDDIGNRQPIMCSLDSRPWLHGSSLVNYMRQVSFNGLTGLVAFNRQGFRTNFKLDMLGMAPDIGLIKVGEWYSHYDWRTMGGDDTADELGQQQRQAENNSVRSYDELSELYEQELLRYEKLLANGVKVKVPYTKPIWRQSSSSSSSSSSMVSPLAGRQKPKSGKQVAESAERKQQTSHRGGSTSDNIKPALLVNDIIFERLYREQSDQLDTLIVTTKLSQPYFMLKETPKKLEGNDQYEGFAVDLVHELSKLINFKYRWREVADKKYGSKEVLPNGTVVWNGMIGELLRGQADLAIVDLTITAQREEAVDFTLPFMNTGISILFKKPTTKVTTLFSFLSPFSSDVWAYVLAAYCGISANLFLVGHLSPYEWSNPHPCRHTNDDDSETVLKNQFSLLNSFWFTIGSLMQQGSDLTPRSMSTRTIAGIWYFFTLIMISSYTANLAAFLTVEKVVYPIENVRDLSQQQEIKYGCVESGSTCTFFHDSQIDTYKRINETMRKFRTYVRSNDEGQKRVEEGKFAFFMESASIEYIIERNCNLTQIGGLLDSKGYGLATSKRSRLKRPYRTLLSEGILHLQETGMLHVLKNRWWKERRGGGTCTDDGKGGGVTELSLANVGGVFVVLLGGLGISFLVAIAEFMWRARRSGSSRDRICEEMMNDLKFALACKSSTKLISLEKQNSRRSRRAMQFHQRQQQQQQQQLQQHHSRRQQLGYSSPTDLDMQDPVRHRNQKQRLSVKSGPQMKHSESSPARFDLSQGQQQRRQRQPIHKTNKECDPILLHAMLSMLMQQQQQQHQQPLQQQPASNFLESVTQVQNSRKLKADNGCCYNDNTHDGASMESQLAHLPFDNNSRLITVERASTKLAKSMKQQPLTSRPGPKRRLLLSQRTIDITDDSLQQASGSIL